VSDWQNYQSQLNTFVNRLRSVTIENRPALDVLAMYDSEETLHYVDPPYLSETRHESCRNIYLQEMSDGDHIELAEKLKSLKGMVVLSSYDSPLYRSIYVGWQIKEKRTRSCGHEERTEVLFISPSAAGRERQKKLW
jgi:DNA adenine methylase